MFFQRIDAKDYDKVRAAQWNAERLNHWAKKLTAQLSELFEQIHIKEHWGTSFLVDADGPNASLQTPFGWARVTVVIGCATTTNIAATYIFEKLVSSEAGLPLYKAVWAVGIDDGGSVSGLEGGGEMFNLSTMSRHQLENGVVEIALSAIYCIAKEPGYFVSSEAVLT